MPRATGVSRLLQLGSAVQKPDGNGALQMGHCRCADANFAAFCRNQGGNRRGRRIWIGIIPRDGFNRLRGPPPVVAVKAEARLRVELCLDQGPKTRLAFGLGSTLEAVPEFAAVTRLVTWKSCASSRRPRWSEASPPTERFSA